ncbi:MAG: dephospho-CoA kinase, partial [Candidatus Cloacimonadota bacterium]|nr:dephospho-CoA kinase [Candidatus Cloacimonadota bacterium]
HPLSDLRMQQIIDTSSREVLIFEIPLLFENGLHKAFDLTINILARNEIKIKRIMKRDGIKKDIAQKKINSQMPELDKQKLADINIVNESDLDNLFLQFQRLLPHLKELKKKDIKKITEL